MIKIVIPGILICLFCNVVTLFFILRIVDLDKKIDKRIKSIYKRNVDIIETEEYNVLIDKYIKPLIGRHSNKYIINKVSVSMMRENLIKRNSISKEDVTKSVTEALRYYNNNYVINEEDTVSNKLSNIDNSPIYEENIEDNKSNKDNDIDEVDIFDEMDFYNY